MGAYIVDVGLFNLLAYSLPTDLPGNESLTARIISVIVSVIFAWIANGLWTFKRKRNESEGRGSAMFTLVNLGGLLIVLDRPSFFRYILHLATQLADNVSGNIVSLILDTTLRCVMYRYFVFSPVLRCEEVASCGEEMVNV